MRGVVAAGDRRTVEAGAAALDAGGNAIDAVCAAAFASWVVEAPLGSAAGAGLLLHGDAAGGYRLTDFFTRVPGLGLPPVRQEELDFYVVTVDYGPTTQPFHIGRGSAAVPTCVFGLVQAHARHGRLPLAHVVAPALGFARDGVQLSPHVQRIYGMLDPILSATPTAAAIHRVDGRLPTDADTVRNPGLADFFDALGADGERFLYGPYVDALLRDFGPQAGGRLTRADFEHLPVSTRPPLQRRFLGHTVLTPAPPASGGTLVTLGLLLAERTGLHRESWWSPAWARGVARVLRAVSVARASGFDAQVFQPGVADRWLHADAQARWLEDAAREERSLGETTHISVIDGDGGAAAFTMSNGEGCGHALPEFGVHVNNFLGEEDINPAGFHALPAGSPMTTMMTPTVVLGPDGQPAVVAGSGGANRIRSAVLLALLARIGHGRSLDEAANAPRIHVEGEQLWFEDVPSLEPGVADALQAACERCQPFDHLSMFFGGVNLAGRDGSTLTGAGDRRRGGRHQVLA